MVLGLLPGTALAAEGVFTDVTVTKTGKIQASGRSARLYLNCPLTNEGTIALDNGAFRAFSTYYHFK